MPDYYFELRRQQIAALEAALDVLPGLALELERLSGRRYGAVDGYRLDDAEQVLVALGSSAGTIKDVVDELREEGERVGLLKIVSFRPFPEAIVAELLRNVQSVVVLDRAASPGGAAPLRAEVATALSGNGARVDGHVYGLGGRDLHPEDVRDVFAGRAGAYVGLRGEPCPA
jgi:pyruvate ferredoxin oxidoreductase alpha subunit